MKKFILIAVAICTLAGCKSQPHLSEQSEDLLDTFSCVAESYHEGMGHVALNEVFSGPCQFARDFDKQNDALVNKLAAIDDHGNIFPGHERLYALAAAVTHLRQTAAWDTGARGEALAQIHFGADKTWPIYYHKLLHKINSY